MRESYPIIKKNHLLISLLCFTLLIFDSCNNPEEVKPVAGAQRWFNKTLGMQWDAWPNKAKIQSIDWDNAITHGTTIEVPVRLEEKIAGQYYNGKESSKNEIAMRLVLWQESEEYHAIVLEILQQGGNMPIHLGDIEKSRFSGLLVANLGGGKKYATIIDKGNSQQKKLKTADARVEDLHCIYYVHEQTATMSGYTHTIRTTIFQGCYDDTEPQPILPNEGEGGWYFDYNSSQSGGNSDWSPGPPTNPQDGDIYESTDYDGKTTLSRYNASTSEWEWLQITLPAAVVNAHPDQYPFIYNIPTNIQVLRPDNLVYSFNESLMCWVVYYGIQNQIKNPCLSKVANQVLQPSLRNTHINLIMSIFNETNNLNWIIKEQNNIDGNAQTPPAVLEGGMLNITTILDPIDLTNKPQEFIASTILHESTHAILHYYWGGNTDPDTQHIIMLSDYLTQIGEAIHIAYPSISTFNAKGLLLSNTFVLKPQVRSNLLFQAGYTESQILAIFQAYSSGQSGTPCN